MPPRKNTINGHASIGPIKTLERMARQYEEELSAIRTTIALFARDQHQLKARRAPAILASAIALDAERVAGVRPRRVRDGAAKARKLAKRRETADILASLDAKAPRTPVALTTRGKVVGLLQHGYIKKKGAGYVRTSKPFRVGDEAP